jgi:hypothetical protein
MSDEDDLTGRKGLDDIVDRMDPVVFIRGVPVLLMDAGKAILLLPTGLPVLRA